MTVPAYQIARYQRLARSFGTWSASVDALTDAHRKHLSDCKAAGERVDAYLREHSDG